MINRSALAIIVLTALFLSSCVSSSIPTSESSIATSDQSSISSEQSSVSSLISSETPSSSEEPLIIVTDGMTGLDYLFQSMGRRFENMESVTVSFEESSGEDLIDAGPVLVKHDGVYHASFGTKTNSYYNGVFHYGEDGEDWYRAEMALGRFLWLVFNQFHRFELESALCAGLVYFGPYGDGWRLELVNDVYPEAPTIELTTDADHEMQTLVMETHGPVSRHLSIVVNDEVESFVPTPESLPSDTYVQTDAIANYFNVLAALVTLHNEPYIQSVVHAANDFAEYGATPLAEYAISPTAALFVEGAIRRYNSATTTYIDDPSAVPAKARHWEPLESIKYKFMRLLLANLNQSVVLFYRLGTELTSRFASEFLTIDIENGLVVTFVEYVYDDLTTLGINYRYSFTYEENEVAPPAGFNPVDYTLI